MSFIPENTFSQKIPPFGNPSARIAIIGDYCDFWDAKNLRPFSGPSGGVLETCLHAAGLITKEVYIDTVIPAACSQKTLNSYFTKRAQSNARISPTEKGQDLILALQDRLQNSPANVFVACGEFSAYALAKIDFLSTYRGYVFSSAFPIGQATKKVIPTFHPRESLRGNYLQRHLITADLKKAKELSNSLELVRPERNLKYTFHSLEEALEWLEFFEHAQEVSFDIEVLQFELACISFAASPDLACSIPLADGWTVEEEACLWRGIQKVLGNPDSIKVGQNLMFDIHFLATRCGIIVRGPIHDTMLAHSVIYPELRKGLGFLGSLYCGAQEYWKDSVKFSNIKEDS